ncbi:MAG: polyribonucleotide nucleotidyltransferase [Candidatus Cloacimonetes bacterium HGW-Cloacimonetes-1]|jgi:polyribonucleotide nucleotidyltransferase|nr:MAG: polyribonucleotide nucleotidyltransferase [Candidatus Cloacimonetes bacterium HGW-Cloacimonetes-1]
MHNFNIIKKSITSCGRELTVETGRMAKQANGAVLVTYGQTTALVTATMGKEPNLGTDFFPLTVDFIEKMYAAGKIPGGFFKRESKPSTDATLNARQIDRAIRPLFPEGFRNPVHIVINILSYDCVNDTAIVGMLGASLALAISDIPFDGPIAGVLVGYIDDELVVNPYLDVLKEKSKLNLSIAGSDHSICMIESAAHELHEDIMLEAVFTGHEEIKKIVAMQKEFILEAGKEKITPILDVVPTEIMNKVEAKFADKVAVAAMVKGKHERQDAFDAVEAEMVEFFTAENAEEYTGNVRFFALAFHELIRRYVRDSILHHKLRADGRDLDELRDITCEIDVLPIVHGTALFTRGETQSLGALTLGGGSSEQIIDNLETEHKKAFYLHYNFPPFSVGEAGRMGPTGRRELGHGNLAERALLPILPSKDVFPYTMRIVAETLESNGSSSMASVCSGCLAMMAAGVPIKAPVAGIANGLIMEGDEYVVLTDIMGLEDHLGDMDFKVAGTREGITAMQMDIKIKGITKDIMKIALEKANKARNQILDVMAATISEPRAELSPTAPRIESFKVPIDKIGEIIGPAGKMIKSIIEKAQVQVDIQDDGTVRILSPDGASIEKAKKMIYGITHEPEIDEQFSGPVTRIEAYGVFVKILDGLKEGMVHVSQMHTSRINHPLDMVKLGDIVNVKVIGMEKGKIALAMKGLPGNPEPDPNAPPQPYEPSSRDRDRGPSRPFNGRGDRNDRNRR